jgi:hypothetical protein
MGRAISVSCVALPFGGFCSSSLMFPLRLMVASLLTSVQSEQSKAGSSRELTGNRTFQLRKYRDADKSLARPGRKQAWKHVRDARDFNKIETLAVIKVFFMQGKTPKEIQASLKKIISLFPCWSG